MRFRLVMLLCGVLLGISAAATTDRLDRIVARGELQVCIWLVAVTRGTCHEEVMRRRLQQAELIVTETAQGREQELEAGRVDVFMTDYPYSRRLLDSVGWARLIEPPEPFFLTPYGYALKPGDDRWYERVEQFMRTIKQDGRLQAAAERYGLSPLVVLDAD